MVKHYHIILKGNFRYSGFRFHTLMAAHSLSINGMVIERDGNIIIEAEGNENELEEFITWCRAGNQTPAPESVEVIEKPLAYYNEFLIL
jgi:acylphosphatase